MSYNTLFEVTVLDHQESMVGSFTKIYGYNFTNKH